MLRGMEGFAIGMILFHLQPFLPVLRAKLLHAVETLVIAALIFACHYHQAPSFLDFVYFLVLFPLLLLLSLYDNGWLAIFLSWPLCRWLGKISYSLYLWQTVLLKVFNIPSLKIIPDPMQGILFMAILIPLSYASYRYLEKPGRIFILKRGSST